MTACLVYMTTETPEQAREIGRKLVEDRLALPRVFNHVDHVSKVDYVSLDLGGVRTKRGVPSR